MSDAKKIIKEIHDLTSDMIGVGLCRYSNFPKQAIYPGEDGPVEEISIPGVEEASVALKERPYAETYRVLRAQGAFNIEMIDGALVQFRYRFQSGSLVKHVLSFFPSPDLLEYQNDPEIYDLDVLYAEVVAKDIVTTPIRFDFDIKNFQDYIHPTSHFTIGQYKNCRIPVRGGLTPFRFMNFVLRAFYNTAYLELCTDWKRSAPDFEQTVTEKEAADLHWSFL